MAFLIIHKAAKPHKTTAIFSEAAQLFQKKDIVLGFHELTSIYRLCNCLKKALSILAKPASLAFLIKIIIFGI
jgi:hypothetical protein